MKQVAWVFLGSGFGGVARYLFGAWALRTFGPAFPFGTIAINTLGSFLIVIIIQLGTARILSADVRLTLATGVMGGFTTYSSFNYETIALVEQGAWRLGAMGKTEQV